MRYGCCLLIGILVLTPGCKSRHSVDRAKVTGKVLLQGKPLPGGRVTFLSVNGGFASSDVIDENGNYQIEAPVGDVKIAVDNSMVGGGGRRGGPPRTFRAPSSLPARKRKPPSKALGCRYRIAIASRKIPA